MLKKFYKIKKLDKDEKVEYYENFKMVNKIR